MPQGLLVPRSALGEWLERGVDVVKEKERIVIRPRPVMLDEREEAIRILEEAGSAGQAGLGADCLLLRCPFRCRSGQELAGATFSVGRPLSQIIMEEHAEGW